VLEHGELGAQVVHGGRILGGRLLNHGRVRRLRTFA
jgi:hypothetical protein